MSHVLSLLLCIALVHTLTHSHSLIRVKGAFTNFFFHALYHCDVRGGGCDVFYNMIVED